MAFLEIDKGFEIQDSIVGSRELHQALRRYEVCRSKSFGAEMAQQTFRQAPDVGAGMETAAGNLACLAFDGLKLNPNAPKDFLGTKASAALTSRRGNRFSKPSVWAIVQASGLRGYMLRRLNSI